MITINLLPWREKQYQARMHYYFLSFITGSLIIFSAMLFHQFNLKKTITLINQQTALLERLTETLTPSKKLTSSEQFYRQYLTTLQLLQNLYNIAKLLPEETVITRITADTQQLTVRGKSGRYQTVIDFSTLLGASQSIDKNAMASSDDIEFSLFKNLEVSV